MQTRRRPLPKLPPCSRRSRKWLGRRSGIAADDICGGLVRARDPGTGRTLSDRDMVDMRLTLSARGKPAREDRANSG